MGPLNGPNLSLKFKIYLVQLIQSSLSRGLILSGLTPLLIPPSVAGPSPLFLCGGWIHTHCLLRRRGVLSVKFGELRENKLEIRPLVKESLRVGLTSDPVPLLGVKIPLSVFRIVTPLSSWDCVRTGSSPSSSVDLSKVIVPIRPDSLQVIVFRMLFPIYLP